MPTDVRQELIDFVEKYKNTVCLMYGDTLVRLLDFYEDDADYYYVAESPWFEHESLRVVRYSAVGGCVALKGYIPEDDYQYVLGNFNFNMDRCFKHA